MRTTGTAVLKLAEAQETLKRASELITASCIESHKASPVLGGFFDTQICRDLDELADKLAGQADDMNDHIKTLAQLLPSSREVEAKRVDS